MRESKTYVTALESRFLNGDISYYFISWSVPSGHLIEKVKSHYSQTVNIGLFCFQNNY